MINVSVSPLFVLLLIYAYFFGFLEDIMLLFIVVLLHECGHVAAARYFGWRVRRIRFQPFGGEAEIEEHGNRPLREEIIVLSAGPAVNVLLLCVSYCFLLLTSIPASSMYAFMEYNVWILLFNLLPIWPLDGGKLVQAILSMFVPYKRAIRISLISSALLVIVFCLIVATFLPQYIMFWVMFLFLMTSLVKEYRRVPYQLVRFLLAKENTGRREDAEQDVKVQHVPVLVEQPVHDILETMYRDRLHFFVVFNRDGRVQHVFHEQEVLDSYFASKYSFQRMGDLVSY